MILKGEHLFVTGGAAGIGEAIVLGAVKEGAKVSFVDIDDAKANALVEKLTKEGHQVQYAKADVSKFETFKAGYDKLINSSGVSKYTTGTQATRTAAALALVKKYYPKAAAGSGSIKINLMLPANNSRRAAEAALVIAEEAKAGFTVSAPPISGWGGKLDQNSFDAEFYAWCPTSVTQTGTNANYQSDGGNNHIGYVSARMDKLLHSLEVQLTPAQVLAKWIQADSILIQDAVSLGIFQHPAATAYNSALINVKPAPLSPNLVWNYWEWHY